MFQNCLFDDEGEILLFKLVDFCSEGVGSVVVVEGAFGLEKGGAAIIVLVDEVDGDTAFLFVVGDDCLVDVFAVHALATVFGQEGRVDVDDAVGEGIEDFLWNQPEETGEDNPVDVSFFEILENAAVVVEVVAVEVLCWDVELFGSLGDEGIGAVVDDAGDVNLVVASKVFADALGIGPVTRGEDG